MITKACWSIAEKYVAHANADPDSPIVKILLLPIMLLLILMILWLFFDEWVTGV